MSDDDPEAFFLYLVDTATFHVTKVVMCGSTSSGVSGALPLYPHALTFQQE